MVFPSGDKPALVVNLTRNLAPMAMQLDARAASQAQGHCLALLSERSATHVYRVDIPPQHIWQGQIRMTNLRWLVRLPRCILLSSLILEGNQILLC